MRATFPEATTARTVSLLILGAMVILIVLLAAAISGGMGIKTIVLLVGVMAAGICFFNTEMALYLILFAMLFSPEFSLGGSLAEGRSLVIRVEDILIFIVFMSWLVKTAIYKGIGLFATTPLNQGIRLYIFAAFISTLLGAIRGNLHLLSGLLYVFKYIEFFLVYFIFTNNITEKDQVVRFLIAAMLVAVFTGLYASVQIPFGIRVSAPFEGEAGEPNTLGGYLILIISVCGGLWHHLKNPALRRLLVGIIAFLLIPFLFTMSRSSWVAAVPMFVVFYILTDKRALLTILLLLSVVAAPFILPDAVKDRITQTFTPETGFENTVTIGETGLDPSTSMRIDSFKYSLNKWKQRPLMGWGITGVGIIDSTYFRLLAEMGLVGVAAFGFLMYVIFRYLYRTYSKSEDPLIRGLAMGLIAGTAALLGHSVGAASFIIVRIMEPYWFFLGALFVLERNEHALRDVSVPSTSPAPEVTETPGSGPGS
ncbi:MAG: O-antigen ligase family protein [Deltaproteobacteria bacterium]|nr:O-antigen ligase family protein [Candidatus Zymogenaceae bacterium]